MTELEKMERAKMYIDKLANGINPLDDTMAPEGDIVNNVRLSRCFFYVADVLRQVIENGGIQPAAPKKPKKAPFEIPPEKREQFARSERPIPISEIARRINALVESEEMKKLSYSAILNWLVAIGMMELVTLPDGKRTRWPTGLGRENGILMEERVGSSGPYQAVVYDQNAQQFIVDNLDAILALENG